MTGPEQYVEGAKPAGSFSGEDDPALKAALEELKKKLAEYRAKGQQFLDSHKALLQHFARDTSLQFRLSDRFMIELETGVVHLDAQWFFERGLNERQILWACFHELSHFRDLATDPEGMKASFEHIDTKARETGAIILEKLRAAWGSRFPDELAAIEKRVAVDPKQPERTMNRPEMGAYKIHHTFWNILDDIHVNNLVWRNMLQFEPGTEGGKDVERLYREKLFKGTDYTKSDDGRPVPRHLQFAYALIRPEMVPGEVLTLSPEVQAALDQHVSLMGMRLTPREVVQRFIKPRSTTDTRASVRNPIARKALEPLYERLLKMDLDEWQPEDPQPGGGGGSDGKPGGSGGEPGEPAGEPTEPEEGEEPGEPGEPGTEGGKKERKPGKGPWMPFEKDHDTFNQQQSPDNITDQDREDYKEAKEKKTKEGEKERREREATEQEEAWCERNGISPEQLARYRELQVAVAPHLRRLAALWDRIIGAAGRDAGMEMRGHFRAGALDVPEAIRQFPAIKSGNVRDVRVMRKMQETSMQTDRPELIRVRLLCDQSGSMFSDENTSYEKRHTAKMNALVHSVVLVLESLSLFQAKLNATRARTGSKLHVDTEVIRFGSRARHLKRLRTVSGKEEDLADAIRAVTQLDSASRGDGDTLDHQAMELVLSELDEKQRADMRARKIIDLVIEITDGGSGDPEAAKENLDQLLTAGAIARSVQAGVVYEGETAVFNQVWNDGRAAPLGEAIGEHVDKLADVLERLLAEHLGTVRA